MPWILECDARSLWSFERNDLVEPKDFHVSFENHDWGQACDFAILNSLLVGKRRTLSF